MCTSTRLQNQRQNIKRKGNTPKFHASIFSAKIQYVLEMATFVENMQYGKIRDAIRGTNDWALFYIDIQSVGEKS